MLRYLTNGSPISGTGAAVSVVTTYATKETGEPFNIVSSEAHSVWWRWTPPADGSVTITTVGSSFDTTLGVYAGGAVNALTRLASDDDSGGGTPAARPGRSPFPPRRHRASA